VDRRGFLVGATALLAAGCARVPPPEASLSPASTAPAAAPLTIGQDATPAGAMLAQLIVGALMAKGRGAAVAAQGKDWQAALGHGDLSALPAYAGTVWASLSKDDEPPAAKDLLGEVAGLLAPDVSALPMPGVDGSLVWRVTADTARDGITSLARLRDWSEGKVAAVPKLAVSRADGVPGLKTVYGARFELLKVDDPVQRASLLTGGTAVIAAFRQTEYTGASGLVDLVDVEKLTVADPGLVLVNTALTDAEPEQVLTVDAVAQALTTDMLLDLQAQVAAGGTVADVATRWLKEQGLA